MRTSSIIAIFGSLILIGSLTTFIWLEVKGIEVPWLNILQKTGIVMGAFIITSLIIFGIIKMINYLTDKSKLKAEIDLREVLDVEDVLQEWEQAFIEGNKIQHIIQHWNKKKKVPINKNAFFIKNIKTYPDPSNQTADYFMAFEVFCNEGKRVGSALVLLRIDRGLEWIKKNWRYCIEWNIDMSRSNVDYDSLPVTTSATARDRWLHERISLMKEGYSDAELRKSIDPFMRVVPQNNTSTSAPPQKETKKENNTQQFQKNDKDNSGEDELEEDVKRYVESNR
ncbi:MAG: hypothetical protein ACE5RP_00065 [Nitrosopumilus sp.]